MQEKNQQKNFDTWLASSYLSGSNAGYLEELYETYLKDPNAVPPEWRDYFQSLPKINGIDTTDISHADIRHHFLKLVTQPKILVSVSADAVALRKQECVDHLIEDYRRYGHLAAKLDPLGSSRPEVPELELEHHDLSRSDDEKKFRAPELMGTETSSLADIVKKLQQTYCDSIGYEYMTIRNPEERRWLQVRIEKGRATFSPDEKRKILKQLIAADGLEKYLGAKYVGQKRFSLEGGDSLIPLLQKVVEQGTQQGLKSMVLGMAHRGRLNVLLNVIGQSPQELFQEFEGKKDYGLTSGDVKYHLGFATDVETSYGPVHLSLAFNPSHLEAVSPVVEGSVRARQDRRQDFNRRQVMPILMHGDAAFSGQGVVMETLNMSQTRAYFVGGTFHIVINNQIGFTTDPKDARSSTYCTDIAKMIDSPVFHVNADDPEAVVFLAQLAMDYRTTFHKDIVIDLVCYRRMGHNEADEPAATQPLMYHKIKSHPVTREIYAKQLIEEKVCTEKEIEEYMQQYREALDKGKQIVPTIKGGISEEHAANWSKYIGQQWNVVVDTSLTRDQLKELAAKLEQLPADFELQRQVGHMVEARNKMLEGELPMDWGCAETLAYASLLIEGYPIRICGQDSQRGTFGHRHAVLHDQKTDQTYIPLIHLSKDQARFEIYDSILSEAAAVGFEYGYAASDPQVLVIWEAQFGDFANGAQVIIDQFISSGWNKWRRLAGLVMLLPHGYEGQGPEHSSARLERYLQLCAENNIQVCIPSTPAQMFHLLRRQMIRPYRHPLIVMTPKSLLRNKLAVSALEDLISGTFQLVIPEIDELKASKIRRIILCSGKVYYDLLTKRRENKQEDVAIIRLEQLYPFPYDELKTELQRYKNAKEVIWCQEEPKNQGAWFSMYSALQESLSDGQVLKYVGRKYAAAPAAGYPALHLKQQTELVNDALNVEHLQK